MLAQTVCESSCGKECDLWKAFESSDRKVPTVGNDAVSAGGWSAWIFMFNQGYILILRCIKGFIHTSSDRCSWLISSISNWWGISCESPGKKFIRIICSRSLLSITARAARSSSILTSWSFKTSSSNSSICSTGSVADKSNLTKKLTVSVFKGKRCISTALDTTLTVGNGADIISPVWRSWMWSVPSGRMLVNIPYDWKEIDEDFRMKLIL